jgi:uncharacterized protein DUF1799
MYEKQPDLEEAAGFGFTAEDYEAAVVGVWPDVMPSVRVFQAMGTQWRMGFNGPIGLDYGALREVWQRLRVPSAERDWIFADLQVMERAALDQMRS